ncbi:hypothetical protein IFM89_032881 [Coptis chinensis]|uniref:Uncharacterized protein n=1 Tax=Coptis chinensis TaxID=261450 RepID=A0A835IS55_9MAGN|nr:hypothetical protein IFM89_032881 [Coptis chinensis]
MIYANSLLRLPSNISPAQHTCHKPPILSKLPFFLSTPTTQQFPSLKFKKSTHPTISMASSDGLQSISITKTWTQLNNKSDFASLLSSDGYISICGFGSLLSEKSARSTFPELINFRIAKLNGFRRVFAHAAPIFFQRGIANAETQEISSLSVEPCEGESLVVTVFEIKESEIPSFIEREHEFRFLAVVPETLEGRPFTNRAVLCGRYSDEEYFQVRCKGYSLKTSRAQGAHLIPLRRKPLALPLHSLFDPLKSSELLFEDPFYPGQEAGRSILNDMDSITSIRYGVMISYLAVYTFDTEEIPSVLAARNLSDVAYNNFLDHTFLGDRKTTIRQYLGMKGSGIMEEEPPETLKTRYGG